MARRSDHTREELKDLILHAAWHIIGKEGHEALTARRVASVVGYAPGTLYNVFESMDGLCLQINARTLELMYEVLESPPCNDPKKEPVENMKAMARQYMAFARAYRPYWRMLFTYELPQTQGGLDWYQEKIDRLFEPLEHLLRPLFSGRGEEERKKAARVLWASIHGLCLLQETGKIQRVKEEKAEDMADYLIGRFIGGLETGE